MNNYFVFPLAAIAPFDHCCQYVTSCDFSALNGVSNKLATYKHHENMASCMYEQE